MGRIRNVWLRFGFRAGVFCLCAGWGAAGADTVSGRHPAGNEWLRAATELVRETRDAAGDEGFARLFVSDDEVSGYMRRIGAADYDSLQKVTVAEIPRRALTAGLLKQAFPASDIDTARCRRLTEILGNRINPALLVSTLNGQEGSVHLAACSVLASTHTYVRPQDWREDLLLVLEYGGEYAVAVAFWQSGEETVTGQAAFIRADRTDALLRSAEEFCGNPIRIRVLTGENLKKTAI